MSYLKTKRVQLGDNVTASNNFVLRQPDTADGTMRISNGIVGAETDLVTVTSAGNVGIGTDSPATKLHVYNSSGGNATDKATMLSEAVLKLQPHTSNSTNLLVAQVNNGYGIGLQVTNLAATGNWDLALSPFGGNVGIGTVAPEKQLHITTITNNGGTITGGADRQGSVIRLQHTINHEVGYTGGDFLGGLEFFSGDGSSGTGVRTAIRTSADDPYNTHSLRFYTASSNSTTLNETMRIDASGRVTKPYQPSIRFGRNNGHVSAGSVIVFTNGFHSVGSDYNNTNGRFTAPIGGRYLIAFNGFNTNGANTQVQIRKNGTVIGYNLYYGTVYGPVSQTHVVELTALDYIDAYVNAGTVYAGGANADCSLSVQLLG